MSHTTTSSAAPVLDIAIIGGGASGMTAAIAAHTTLADHSAPPCRIAVFERNNRLGKKLLTTGNGRCNLTNRDCTVEHFHGEDTTFLQSLLIRFTPEAIESFFATLGLICTNEDSKVFPASLHASSVLDTLRLQLTERDISITPETQVIAIEKQTKFFLVKTSGNSTFKARTVIVSTGGSCAPATGSDGNGYRLLLHFSHELIPPVPSIVQITTDTVFVKPLSGQKIRGTITLRINEKKIRTESGEILFTDYGLSGPPVLQLSGDIARTMREKYSTSHPVITVTIDFLPHMHWPDLHELLRQRRNQLQNRPLEDFLTGIFHRRLAYGILKSALHKPLSTTAKDLSDNELSRIADSCKKNTVTVTGTQSFAHAQTTAGGIALGGFNTATFESLHAPGLFACGEVLDIDGECGGYNLHWAWASGYIAGEAAARRLLREHT